MSRQNNKNPIRGRKGEDTRRDAAANALRQPMNREMRTENRQDERNHRQLGMTRQYLNDLYERSSI